MAKFSVGIEDGEGPSNRVPVPKCQRVGDFLDTDYNDYVEEEEESEGEDASEGEEESEGEPEDEEESGAEQGAMSPRLLEMALFLLP
ncbi:hypothetical protein CRYUN_Cryun23aG0019500 [Craigia yunnanensis]